MKEKLELVSKALAPSYALILLISTINTLCYYWVFDISIANFIEISEYATLFLDDLIYYIIYIAITFSYIFLQMRGDYPAYFFSKKAIWIAPAIVAAIILAISIIEAETTSKYIEIIRSTITCLIITITLKKKVFKKNIDVFYSAICFLFLYSAIGSLINAYKLIETESKVEYEIQLKERTIYTNDQIKYVGKTKNYFFLYNTSTQVASIFPTKDLKTMLICRMPEETAAE